VKFHRIDKNIFAHTGTAFTFSYST